MRKITFGVANSLDNFIARADESVDWLRWSEEVADISRAFWQTVDTVLIGRKTYEIGLKLSQGKNPYAGVKTYVFSRTLKNNSSDGVEIISSNAVDFVRDLKSIEGKNICLMGGGEFAKTLLEAGLVDEIGVNIHPVLLGKGVPLFREMNRQIDLELIKTKTLQNGCVYVLYRVKNA